MVDVIIPSYNRRELLMRAVRSVQSQTFKDWNLWVVDDGSSDGTAEKFVKIFGASCLQGGLAKGSAGQTRLIRLGANKGVSYARNRGIEQGRGEWTAFLDSDDEWLPEKLEKQIQFAQTHPDLPLIHCNEIWLKNGRLLSQKKKHRKQGGRIFIPSAKLCCVSPSAALLRRSFLEEVGLFREDFPVCEDYEMWLRAASRYSVGFLEEALIIKHGGHGDQLSRRYPAMDYWRVKALKNYVEDRNLTQEEREQAREILREKARILLGGYKKRQSLENLEKEREILGILKRFGLTAADPDRSGA